MRVTPIPRRAGCALWLVDLDEPAGAQALATLSADERARAGRFIFDRDRERFMAARSALRQVLASHLGMQPAQLVFTVGTYGKPVLAQLPGCRFNLSHSGRYGLIALSPQDEVGVDIEILRDMPDALAMAEAHFDAQDAAALAALPPGQRSIAFLAAWTRGEACLKALGTGFSGPGLPATGIDLAPRKVQMAVPGTTACTARLESFELPEAGAVASLALLDAQARAAAPLHGPRSMMSMAVQA
ncbi:4'-phosphopantetheinyl transferase [Variovorax sp. OV329]|nr:4'-phosphopantetheinyl transferase [Variovorax sp. OV329]